MTSSPINDSEFHALRELSAVLGADPLRTQGAGGNTSIKRDGVMWITASGTWLADALSQDIMAPVRLDPLRKAIADGDTRAATAVDFVDAQVDASGLRPSIETSVHAIIPSPVVVHIHCVNTIALAVRRDGESLARERLRPHADLALAFVPYRKPGLPLAYAIAERLMKDTNVFVLANHGLVVAGGSVVGVADRIERVCEAFCAPARVAPRGAENLAAIVEGTDYRLPQDPAVHAIALDPKSLTIARRGSLYPDHVVFLGSDLAEPSVDGGRLRAPPKGRGPPLMMVLPGLGVVLHRSISKNAEAMARCLADVAARIPDEAPIRVLTGAEEEELMNWEAEAYRQSIGR
jgi:rhamnose utilization protein RhaD (predicted bifunctional aldolase and dehydrogenase)